MRVIFIAAILLAWAAHVFLSRNLHLQSGESILTQSAISRLNTVEFAGISLRYDYLDAIVEGTVYDPEKKEQLAAMAASVLPAGRLVNRMIVEEKNIPVRLQASRDSGGARIGGTVSSEELREALAAAIPGDRVASNQLNVNPRVMDPAWLPTLPELLRQFFLVTEGKPSAFEVNGDSARLSGTVKNPGLKASILAAVKAAGLEATDEIVVGPKETARLTVVSENRKMTIRGLLPDEKVSEALMTASRQWGHSTVSELRVESHCTAPPWLEKAAAFLADLFAEGAPGEVEFSDGKIRIKRPVESFEERNFWLGRARDLDPSAKVTDECYFGAASKPFEFGFKKEGNKILVAGWLPSLESKKALQDAIERKFKGFQVENKSLSAPNIAAPPWLSSLPKYVESLPAPERVSQIIFDAKGIELPEGTQREDTVAFQKAALAVFGKEFPGLDPEVVNPPNASPPAAPANVAGTSSMPAPPPPQNSEKPKTPPTLLPTVVTSSVASRREEVASNSYPCNLYFRLKGAALTMSGNIPDANLKNQMQKAATGSFPGLTVKDELNIDGRVIPPDWKDAFAAVVQEMLKHRPVLAEMEIDFGRLRLKQVLPGEPARQAVVTRAGPLLASNERRFINQLTLFDDPIPQSPEPAKSDPAAPEASRVFVVYFAPSSYRITSEAETVIRRAVENILAAPPRAVFVKGYTDASGSSEINLRLSAKRAERVSEELISRGVSRSLIQIESLGKTRSQQTASSEDRRVEIVPQ